MKYDETQLKKEAAAKLGVRQAESLVPYAASRLHGMLYKAGRSDEFDAAFPHIRDHFYLPSRLNPEKKTHTKFLKRYCSKDAVKDLLLQAANAPSYAKLTRLTGDGASTFAIKIVRQFGSPIGEGTGLTCLLIIFDEKSTLITAYPMTLKGAWDA